MKDLTEGNEGKVILQFALPMLLGNVFQQLYNVVDSIVVGNFLGKEALSAVGASFPVIFAITSLIIGFVMGASIMISQFFGAKKFDKVRATIDTMNISLLVLSVAVAIGGVAASETIFKWMDLPADIRPMAVQYLNVTMMGAVTAFGYNATSSILRGLGDSKTPLYFLIISTLVNIVLDLVFVLVMGWGIEAVAWATVISQGVSFISAVVYLNLTHEIIRFRISEMSFHFDLFWKSLRIGIPSGAQHLIVALGMTALQKIVNQFGSNVIAAYAIVGRIDSFAVMPAINFSMAISSFVGQNIGANKLDRISNGLWATMKMMALISALTSVISVFFARELLTFFTQDQAVIEAGVLYLHIVAPFYISFAVMFSFNGVFRGAGDTIIPMFNTLAALWAIRVPSSYYFSEMWGESGIWWGIPFAWLFSMLFGFLYYLTGRWKKFKVT